MPVLSQTGPFFIYLGAIFDCNIGFPQWHSMAETLDITRVIN